MGHMLPSCLKTAKPSLEEVIILTSLYAMKYQMWLYVRKIKVWLKVQVEVKSMGEEHYMWLIEHGCGGRSQECVGPQ